MIKTKYLLNIAFVFLFWINLNSQEISFGIENDLTIVNLENSMPYTLEDDGVWRVYYETGELHAEARFKKAFNFRKLRYTLAMEGCKISYTKNGEISRVEEYKRGKLVRTVYLKK